MQAKDALSISIGVLGGVATLLTAEVLDVPVWVIFIAWASFFIVGGGKAGLVRSVASNVTGIAIATATLLVIDALDGGSVVAAICVGLGSAAMVQASKVELLSTIPAIVWGFASTVGTQAVTGTPITEGSIDNPALIAAVAMVLGALFGIVSERVGAAMTAEGGARRLATTEGAEVQP